MSAETKKRIIPAARRELNRQARILLGVSLKATRFLLDSSPCTLIHSDILDRSDGRKHLQELVASGLGTIESHKHRPPGYEKEIELLEFRLLEGNDFDDCDQF